ncbi:lipopolysaccharide biosynthesis protein [Nocardioides anomalus]|uniref:Lipopolysaccharide biosynthesis protein n=1 Tax=Nocardioides anomalus TaxID=2712223 RepID=A0A6G6WGE6_9ACTN|nr:polysaccharide biosynthesis C-terminal domain-containing protein [Nocardioides anomalus]QIG44398.1 lipopolysaccharide biosynthesis protein [Nocardioides anomalus]
MGAAFSAVSGIALVVIVTNGFSASLAGTLFAATSTFLILESFALLGTDTGLVKCLPAQLASGRAGDIRRTLVVSAVPVLGLALSLSVAVYAAAPAVAPHLTGDGAAAWMTTMLRALALVMPVAALHDLVMAATRGTGSMRPTVIVDNIGRLGLQAVAVLVVFLADGGPLALALAWSLPYAVGFLAGVAWLHRQLVRRTSSGLEAEHEATPWGSVAREFWTYTAPRAIARVTQTALKRSDIVLVAALASPAEAALYTAATRFIVVGQLFVQSVQQALSPQIAALFARGEVRAANSVYQAATLWSVIAAWPLYLVLAGFAPSVMGVFGGDYHVASDVVVILALTMLLATACGSVDAVLLMAGRSWVSLRNASVALAVNVALNLVLIPAQGIRGAAISWSAAIVVRNLLPLLIVRRQMGMWPVTTAAVRVAAVALACFGAADVVGVLTDLPRALDLGLVGLAAAVYLRVVWSWREALSLDTFASAVRRRSNQHRSDRPEVTRSEALGGQ